MSCLSFTCPNCYSDDYRAWPLPPRGNVVCSPPPPPRVPFTGESHTHSTFVQPPPGSGRRSSLPLQHIERPHVPFDGQSTHHR
jgi:hypothetical protein